MLKAIKRAIKMFFIASGVLVALVIGLVIFDGETSIGITTNTPVEPDWAAIAAWPGLDADTVEAQPDPARTFTAIILDDSGSMGADIVPARDAVVAALGAMQPDDRVAVIALNAGTIVPFLPVAEAQGVLPPRLARVISEGSTPLTEAVQAARAALASEAAIAGGFGTYRILVTTDGAADDGVTLQAEIEEIARATPIQLATVGVGIRGNHILRRDDLAAFVEIDNVAELESALRSAIAEEQTFSAITTFGDG